MLAEKMSFLMFIGKTVFSHVSEPKNGFPELCHYKKHMCFHMLWTCPGQPILTIWRTDMTKCIPNI